MSHSQCQTCTDLLMKLSGASGRLFYISSELTCATLKWTADQDGPPSEELLRKAQTLRAECAQIRQELHTHRIDRHGESVVVV
jgi:hypothetical protein